MRCLTLRYREQARSHKGPSFVPNPVLHRKSNCGSEPARDEAGTLDIIAA